MRNVYGLLGEKLGHSISPQIHNLIFKELNINGNYNLFEVEKDKLRVATEGLKVLGVLGVNVTIPYKVEVIRLLDHISIEAEKIGAVNTICFNNGIATGFNTDYLGFGMLLDKHNVEIKNKKIIVLGTGGASKAITQYFEDRGVSEITLVTRKIEKGVKISNNKIISYNELIANASGDIIVNCTPLGMYPNINSSPVEEAVISRFETAVDLIYNPFETLFLKYANEVGAKTANGLYMLIGQALAAEELWNNISIDRNIADKIYKNLMENIYE